MLIHSQNCHAIRNCYGQLFLQYEQLNCYEIAAYAVNDVSIPSTVHGLSDNMASR